ncbi:alpha/beta hydrolase [Aequoribacter sp.]|uniref:alpha/beta hydrolase n=1 Tax=Aequoribacter sp. TaxID=2847771 RepID=UPI003F69B95A
MSYKHLVHPSLETMTSPEMAFEINAETLQTMRDQRSQAIGLEFVQDLPVSSETVFTTLNDGHELKLVIYQPAARSAELLPVVYHMHGGGMVMGTPEMMEVRNKLLVNKLGIAVVSVDYRLAPEHAHPIPVEDCYAGYQWTVANAQARGFDASRIVSMGESAGGGLAAALSLLLRDRGDRSLLGQYLIYPMLDDRTASTVEPAPPVGEFIWTRASNRFGWGALLGHEPGGEGVSPYAAPARAADVSGLPTTFMYTGALDLFMEEDLEYAKRLMCAGVPTELHVYQGAIHAFEMLLTGPIAEQASTDIQRSLRALLQL